MLKRVLVPLDGSPLSEEALEYAKQIIDPQGTLMLITAVDLPELVPGSFYMAFGPGNVQEANDFYSPEQALAKTRVYLKEVAANITAMTGLNVEYKTEISEPANFIVRMADKMQAGVIVMSTHGRSGFSKWFFGSVTNKVLNTATCPVLVIPSKHRLMEVEQSMSEANYG